MRDVVAKIIAFFQKHLTLVLVGLPLLATLVMLLLGVGIPDDQGTPVLINEISAPKDGAPEDYWIELYNNTDELVDVAGWSIRTLSETVTLDGVTAIGPGGYLIIPADPAAFAAANPILAAGAAVPSQPFHLSQGKGSIELINDKGRTVDATAWPPSTPPVPAQSAPPPEKPGSTLVRRSIGLDSNAASDWRPGPASPGSRSLPTMRSSTRIVLIELTNYISLISGFLLWSAFVLIGLIARRFQRLTGQRTFWQAMVIAPIGIVIYNLIQTNAFFSRGAMTDCRTTKRGWVFEFSLCEQLWSFVPLFIAAAIMTYAILLFYRAARRILEV